MVIKWSQSTTTLKKKTIMEFLPTPPLPPKWTRCTKSDNYFCYLPSPSQVLDNFLVHCREWCGGKCDVVKAKAQTTYLIRWVRVALQDLLSEKVTITETGKNNFAATLPICFVSPRMSPLPTDFIVSSPRCNLFSPKNVSKLFIVEDNHQKLQI